MKKFAILICSLTLVFGVVVNAEALSFTISPGDSSVELSNINSLGWTSLTHELALNSNTNPFGVEEGSTATIKFFNLTATGTGLGYADISATLAFSSPAISASGAGGVGWATAFGAITAGILHWDNSTLPDMFTLSDGTKIGIDFEGGLQIVCGQTMTVHAYITNYGDGTVSVPEPETMLMLGFVLLGLVGVSRKRFNNRN